MRRPLDVYDDLDALTGERAHAAAPLPPGDRDAAEVLDLTTLPLRTPARIVALSGDPLVDPVCRRLDALGFVPGEPVRVSARGPFGGDPLVVDIGSTRFALRRAEASRVRVQAVTQDEADAAEDRA